MEYSFIITRELKQITPYIHFQYDSKGATLRATEVKPKLDAFLISQAKKESKKLDTKFFIGDSGALNYKMKIEASGPMLCSDDVDVEKRAARSLLRDNSSRNLNSARSKIKYNDKIKKINKLENHKFYFANMISSDLDTWSRKYSHQYPSEKMVNDHIEKVENAYKESVFYNNRIKLQIICFNKDLYKLIDENIDKFFILYNFGCRQTKGFGGFLTTRNNRTPSETDIETVIKETSFPFFYFDINSMNNNVIYNNALDTAHKVYSVMKEVINPTSLKFNNENGKNEYECKDSNINEPVVKPVLPNNLGREKAFIKSKILKKIPEFEKYLFIGALFGLADQYKSGDDIIKVLDIDALKTLNRQETDAIETIKQNEADAKNCYVKLRKSVLKKAMDTNSVEIIQRIPSPILIKITEKRVYFILKDSYKQIIKENKYFLFYLNDAIENARDVDDTEIEAWVMKIPKRFIGDSFINTFIENFNKRKIDTKIRIPRSMTLKRGGQR